MADAFLNQRYADADSNTSTDIRFRTDDSGKLIAPAACGIGASDAAFVDFVGGAGAVAAGVQRVTLASDDPAVVDLAAMEVLLTTIDASATAIQAAVEGTLTVGSHAVTNAGTFPVQAAQSGTWNVTNISGTVSLPTGAATAAKQPALGTAGTASSDVITVQGIASMTPILVDGSAATQPVSGTVTANLSATDNAVLDSIDAATTAIQTAVEGTLTVGSHAVTNAGTFPVQAAQSGTWNVTNISGTVSLPTGAATAANQTTLIGHVDGIEGLLTTIDGDTGSILTAVQLLDDTVAVLGTATYTEATTKGNVVGAVRNDDLAALAGTDNEIAPLQVTQNGAAYVCPSANDDYKYAVIDAASSGDNTLVAAVASRKIRVLAAFLVASGAVNVRFESGASGTALTGQMNLTTNSGFTLPFNEAGWFETGVNTLLNLELSGATSVDGCLTYIEVP